MANYITPLLYKPGIHRDGTDFEPFYCREGYWIRFNEGRVKKIGGMSTPSRSNYDSLATNVRILPDINNSTKVIGFVAGGNNIGRYELNMDFMPPVNFTNEQVTHNLENPFWHSVRVIDNGVDNIAFFVTNSGNNIADNTQGKLYTYSILNRTITTIAPTGYDVRASGGLVYSAPFLFLYGNSGLVQFSTRTNPFVFQNDEDAGLVGAGSLNIASDKIIYGRSIRGGTNSPALLFWSLSSVVRIVNSSNTGTPEFQIDVVSSNSTIISSRSVIEYDGLFFWIGTDRFYVYNGIVQAIEKVGSLNFFFDNVDMNHRQLIFGVRNTRWGELWWYYPEKGQDQNNVRNTRAIIYNKDENTWYDTPIDRDAGYFSRDFGFMTTFGRNLSSATSDTFTNEKALWRHEIGVNERIGILSTPILSYVLTPIISVAAFNPKDNLSGIDRFIDLRSLEPDMVMDNDTDRMGLRVYTGRYAQSTESITPLLSSPAIPFTRKTEKIDLRIQARHIRFRFESNKNFKLGNIMLSVNIGDGN